VVADELGVERFFTVGASGDGPHALACAALLPERVIAAGTIGAVARVPGARAQLRTDHGHLSLLCTSYGEVLDDLLACSRIGDQ
jgi:pimeloyl-ACP methyl ester carboxylesterase